MKTLESSTLDAPATPTREERLKAVLDLLAESPPASTAVEANTLLTKLFDQIEEPVRYMTEGRMFVYPLTEGFKIHFKGKEIYYHIYNRHVLFIDEGGAIDIRAVNPKMPVTTALLEKNPTVALENTRRIFEKSGADGHTVWG